MRRAEFAASVFLTLLALFLHITFFTHAGALWRDEANSVAFARMPSLGAAYHALQYDAFPLLSTVLLRGWVAAGMGESDRGFRAFGFVMGVLFLAALWIVCRLFGGRAPVVSLALVGLSPWTIQAVDSIRPYGIGIVLIILTLGFIWKAAGRSEPAAPSSQASRQARVAGWLTAAGALAILSVQSIYQNALILLAICVAGVAIAWRRSDARIAAAILLIGVLAAVSLLLDWPSLVAARAWSFIIQLPTPMGQLFPVLSEALAPEKASAPVAPLGPILSVIWLCLALMCVFEAGRIFLSRGGEVAPQPKSNLVLYGATATVVATVTYLLALGAARLRPEPWYFVPLMVVVAPALDAITGTTTSRGWRIGRITLALAVAGMVAIPAWRQLSKPRTNIDRAAAVVSAQSAAGDLVIVSPFYYGVSFRRYYQGPTAWTTLPPLEDVSIHRYDLLKAQMARANVIEPVLAKMAEALRSGHRVWIVGTLPETDPDRPPVAPSPASGARSVWSSGDYMHSWGQQVAYLLETRAVRGRIVQPLSNGAVNPYEDVPVTAASGWR